MTRETIILDIQDQVATITLNRPERRNAYTARLGQELGEAYRECDEDDSVRAVVLTGAGSAFCVGADLETGAATFSGDGRRERGGQDGQGGPRARRAESDAGRGMQAWRVRKPVIAAINGHAVGAGLTLAMQCDMRFVAEDAKLAFAFVRRGVIPELASHAIVARVAGLSNAADLLLSGRTFSGREAAELGIAGKALPAAEVLPTATAYARDLAVNAAPVSVAISKRLLWEALDTPISELQRKEGVLFAWTGRQQDAKEGVMAFLEKRPPAWTLRPSADLPDWPD
jgi:enoyl-CoA hydratase/carnithine racemase